MGFCFFSTNLVHEFPVYWLVQTLGIFFFFFFFFFCCCCCCCFCFCFVNHAHVWVFALLVQILSTNFRFTDLFRHLGSFFFFFINPRTCVGFCSFSTNLVHEFPVYWLVQTLGIFFFFFFCCCFVNHAHVWVFAPLVQILSTNFRFTDLFRHLGFFLFCKPRTCVGFCSFSTNLVHEFPVYWLVQTLGIRQSLKINILSHFNLTARIVHTLAKLLVLTYFTIFFFSV